MEDYLLLENGEDFLLLEDGTDLLLLEGGILLGAVANQLSLTMGVG